MGSGEGSGRRDIIVSGATCVTGGISGPRIPTSSPEYRFSPCAAGFQLNKPSMARNYQQEDLRIIPWNRSGTQRRGLPSVWLAPRSPHLLLVLGRTQLG